MKRNNTKSNNSQPGADPTPPDHVAAIGELLTQLKSHLTSSAGKKGTYSDYLRLLEFYQGASGTRPRELIVRWIDPERLPDSEAA
jgi:hypothetical protein